MLFRSGTDLDTRYEWKNSVGAPENRPLNENRWRDTFPHRLFTNYYQSLSLGFYEYFLLKSLQYYKMGYACALSWVLLCIIGMVSIFVFRSSESWVHYESKGD